MPDTKNVMFKKGLYSAYSGLAYKEKSTSIGSKVQSTFILISKT